MQLGKYRHSKTGKLHRVLGIAKHSETNEDFVVYEALYDNSVSKLWIQLKKMFLEKVIIKSKKVPRFEFVEEQFKLGTQFCYTFCMADVSESRYILKELREEEKQLNRDERLVKIAFGIVTLLIIILAAGVSYLAFQSVTKSKAATTTTVINRYITPTEAPIPTSTPSPTSTPIPIQPQAQTVSSESQKDYYVDLGSGTNRSTEWTDVAGTFTTVDLGQFGDIKEVSFEAYINVPTANGLVSVRLYNVTDDHPILNSDVTRNGTRETYHFISPPFNYSAGPKLYKIQMKSQLNVEANLVSSRIHIVTY